jgi:hypothetical protein
MATKIVNPRRGSVISIPLAGWKQQVHVQDLLFDTFGLDDIAGCTTGEMRSRPVPQVFKISETKALTDLFSDWAPRIYTRLMAEIVPPLQTLNKTSRLGWPVFKSPPSKKPILQRYFSRIVDEGVEFMNDAFIIMNVRLQAESKRKKREFLFIDSNGEVYSQEVGARERQIETPVGRRTGSRTRLVFNLPVANLLTQVFDSAAHNALLKYPAFHHNMYSVAGAGRLSPHAVFFDVSHFERHTSEIVRLRSRIIGGRYGEIGALFDSLPFLCPTDDWKRKMLLWPNRDAGFSDQFASGYSPVAPVQKEIFWALYSAFAVEMLGLQPDSALSWVAQGGDHRLRIINYGDDNVADGDPGVLRELLPFMNQYLAAQEEDPPKFLGFLYTHAGWKLGVTSYLSKTYLNERRPSTPERKSNFRKFPAFGWVEKRKTYAKYGVPELVTKVFPEEDYQLAQVGIPWSKIETQAAVESIQARDQAGLLDENWILGKDWLMTPEDKLATGEFDGLYPEETEPLLRALLSKEWNRRLSW